MFPQLTCELITDGRSRRPESDFRRRHHISDVLSRLWISAISFLRAKAATALARLGHHNSVRPSVRHTGGSVKNGAS